MTEKRFNSPLYSNMVIDMEHKIPSILCVNEEQKNEFLNGLNALHEENEQLKKQIDELINSIQESARMGADAICKPMMKKQWGNIE